MITLGLIAILAFALFAHLDGQRSVDVGVTRERLAGNGVVLVVALITFITLLYSWAALSPIPVVHDEMSYVLQSQIFARGHWGLPSPPIPAFWEQPHVLVEPVLTSKYFPGHALLLAVGAAVGWPALMPLVLNACSGALLFILARRVSSGAVALLSWSIWLFTPMVLYFGATYFSESTTTLCWLAGWYALLRWRESRELHWLLCVALCTGWDAITRPLTGVAYAIPIAVVVLHDIVRLRAWRQVSLALLAGCAVMSILGIWSANTTGNWHVTPLSMYTRDYMPYDVPGFGLDAAPPARAITPDLQQLNNVYSSSHVTHFVSTLPEAFVKRAFYLSVSIWGSTSGLLIVFAALGLLALTRTTAFAVLSGVVLLATYLLFATPAKWTLYYYETAPAFAYITAAGIAWAVSMLGRPRGVARSTAFEWLSPRWNRALVVGGVLLLLPGLASMQLIHLQHVSDRKTLAGFQRLVDSIHERAILFVRYGAFHSPHVALVRNTADLENEHVWVVYDRGDEENARLLALAPHRKSYLFDEVKGRTYEYDPVAAAP